VTDKVQLGAVTSYKREILSAESQEEIELELELTVSVSQSPELQVTREK
jgi:hypothetical protein